MLSHRVLSPFFTGPLRAPERLQNTFAHECFMDEVAAHVKADPVEYRLKHLNHARLSAAVRAAAKAATWLQRPSPQPSRARAGRVSGRGIACVCYEGDNGYVAMVADVTVDQDPAESRSHGSSSRRTPDPSRTPTACATRSKAELFRASAVRLAKR